MVGHNAQSYRYYESCGPQHQNYDNNISVTGIIGYGYSCTKAALSFLLFLVNEGHFVTTFPPADYSYTFTGEQKKAY